MASCEDKYTTLLDLSRQSEILTGETACLSGKIYAGIPFSGYPSGVDTSTSAITNTTSNSAILSGDSLSTLFDVANPFGPNFIPLFGGSDIMWTGQTFDSLRTLHTSGITISGTPVPITPLSVPSVDGIIVGPFWTATQTGMTGTHVINTLYSGYSVTYTFNNVAGEFSGGSILYSGVTGYTSALVTTYTAGTLDYRGPLDYLSSAEDITASGTVITKKLRVFGGASASTIGYVLTQVDAAGNAEWAFNSASASTNTFVTSGVLSGSDLELTYNTGGSVPAIDLSALSGDSWNLQNVLDEGSTAPTFPFLSTDSVGILPTDTIVLGTGDPFGSPPTTATTLVWLDQTKGTVQIAAHHIVSDVDQGAVKINAENSYGESSIEVSGGEIYISTSGSTILLEADGNILIDGLSGLTSPTVGDVLSAKDTSGRLKWETPSSFTGGTGSCITDLYVTNIHACSPLNINPLDEGDVYFGSTSGVTIDVINSRIGIGTDTPEEKLHVKDGDFLIENGSKFITDLSNPYPTVRFSGSSSILSQIGLTNPDSAGINMGYRGFSEGVTPAYGKQGDAFIYSSAASNGLNLISQVGSGSEEDYIRFYAGQDASSSPSDMIIIGTGATRGFVGVGTETPTEKLHVADGNTLITWDHNDTTDIRIDNFNNGTHARSAIVLVGEGESGTDSSGILTLLGTGYTGDPGNWQGPYLSNSLSLTTGGGNQSTNAHINIGSRRTDGEIRFFSGNIGFDNDTLLGIWNPSGLTLSGDVNTFHFNTDTIQVRNGATSGYVLTSDSNGVGTWQVSSGGSGTFTGNTSGDCINELWVSNISGCTGEDLHIGASGGDIYFDYTGDTSTPNLFIGRDGLIGIGTNTPFSGTWNGTPAGIEIQMPSLNDNIALAFSETGSRRFYFVTDFATTFEPVHIYGGAGPSTTPLLTFYTNDSGGVGGGRIGMGTVQPEGSFHISLRGDVADQTKYPDETNIVINNTSTGWTGATSDTPNSSAFRFDHLSTEKPGALITSVRQPEWESGIYSTNLELWNASGGTLEKRIEIKPEWNTNIYGDIDVIYGGKFWTDLNNDIGPNIRLSGGSDDLVVIYASIEGAEGMSIGSRGATELNFPGYGKNSDGFIYSSTQQNGLNIISTNGVGTEDYIRFYAGTNASVDTAMIILGTGATQGFIGMGTDSPTEKLHVAGSIKMVDGNEGSGKVLTSDANGVGSWQPSSGGGTFTGNTSGTCIDLLWVSTISGCSPVTIGSSIQSQNSTASGDNSFAFGWGLVPVTASGDYSFVAGGRGNIASGAGSFIGGGSTNIASATGAAAFGIGTSALTTKAFTQGSGTTASGTSASAFGTSTIAGGDQSFSEGDHTQALGDSSHAEGSNTIASGNYSHAEGDENIALGLASHAEGSGNTVNSNYSHAEGQANEIHSLAESSHAEGGFNFIDLKGSWGHVEGKDNIINNTAAHAEGLGTYAAREASHAEGSGTTAGGDYSHAEGYGTIAGVVPNGDAAHAEGRFTVAGHDYSHAEGDGSEATGIGSHAEGKDTVASGNYSHAEGSGTTASGDLSHAEGGWNIASGRGSHVEGGGGGIGTFRNIASGVSSHAEGSDTLASGHTSHAEGQHTIASGTSSHAEGYATTARGAFSHAEGEDTLASGESSHAEGWQNWASGDQSHAEGNNNIASGEASHAEGKDTLASGNYSHAEGEDTIASGETSHSQGWNTIAGGIGSYAGGAGGGNKEVLSLGKGSFAHFSIEEAESESVSTGAHQDYSAILGGRDNTIASAGNDSVILGGQWNSIGTLDSSSDYNSIMGGLRNSISGDTISSVFNRYCSIVGGQNNIITAYGGGNTTYSGIFAGYGNKITTRGAFNHTIIGGSQNEINTSVSREGSSIIGGYENTNSGTESVIIGGNNNTINNGVERSLILGGSNITATDSNTVYLPNVDLCTFSGALHSNTIIPCSPLTISPGNEGNVHIGDQGGAPIITLDILTPDEPGLWIGEDSFIRWKESEQKLIIGEEEVGGKVVIEVEGDEIVDIDKEKTLIKEGDLETEDGDIIVKSGNSKTLIIEDMIEVAGDDLGTNAEGKLIDLPSDSRVKENIYPLDTVVDVLEFIKNIKGYQFTWSEESRIGNPNKKRYGFLVDPLRDNLIDPKGPNFNSDHQNINEIAKSMVRTNRTKFKFGGNKQTQSVEAFSKSELLPFFLEAVKAIDVKVDNLTEGTTDKYKYVGGDDYKIQPYETIVLINNGINKNVFLPDVTSCINKTYTIKSQKNNIHPISICPLQGDGRIEHNSDLFITLAAGASITLFSSGDKWWISGCCGEYDILDTGNTPVGGWPTTEWGVQGGGTNNSIDD